MERKFDLSRLSEIRNRETETETLQKRIRELEDWIRNRAKTENICVYSILRTPCGPDCCIKAKG